MRILQVILAPRLSGAEVLAKGVAIGHQRGGNDVCITSLMPEHDDFQHISAELRANNVECFFPQRSLGKLGRLLFLHRAIRRFAGPRRSRNEACPPSHAPRQGKWAEYHARLRPGDGDCGGLSRVA